MYQKYTTEGFIVSTRGSGESDILYLLYTKDFGMVLAHATSVRLSKSKLHPHLNFGTRIHFTLLKSKIRWRLLEVNAILPSLSPKVIEYKIFIKVLTVLKSLIHGEEKNESLFESISLLFDFLVSTHERELLQGAEYLVLVKILHALGYGADIDLSIYSQKDFTKDSLSLMIEKKKEIVKEINTVLGITGF